MTIYRRAMLALLRLWLRYAAWRFRHTPEYKAFVAESKEKAEAWLAWWRAEIEPLLEKSVRDS